jgi:hypothetical protein
MRACARRIVACFAVLALFAQMQVALAHDPAAMQAAAPLFSTRLCHAGHAAPADPAKANSCTVCQLLAAGGAGLPPLQPAALVAVAMLYAPPSPLPARALAAPAPRPTAQPRAPPRLV